MRECNFRRSSCVKLFEFGLHKVAVCISVNANTISIAVINVKCQNNIKRKLHK